MHPNRLKRAIPPYAPKPAFRALIVLCMMSLPCAARGEQNVVVVLDDSGSMEERMQTDTGRKQRIEVAKNSLIQVLGQLPPQTNVGVLSLNTSLNGSNWIVPFGTGTPEEWRQNILRLEARGGTPLGEFLKIGADELLKARANQLYGDYRLLVVTDGEANDERLVERYLPDILSRGLVVDVIGVDMRAQHSLATKVHSYRSANNESSLQQALSEVFAETSADDQDAAEEFEILAALPDGFAEAALEALAVHGNEPVSGFSGNNSGQRSFGVSTPGRGRDALPSVAFGGLFCCFGGIVLVTVVVGVLVASRKRKRF